MSTRTIQVDYLTRVEGDTAILVQVSGRKKPDIKLKIFEPPRFFEGFLVGRHYLEVGDIVARICGICPVSHMTTAIRAIEKAVGIVPSPQTEVMRLLGSTSQIAASHLVHLYALVLPDHAGCPGLSDLIAIKREDVLRMVRMRDVINALTSAVCGGRALHPIGTLPGGFTNLPPAEELAELRERLIGIRPDAEATAEVVAGFDIPTFQRDREFLALGSPDSYAINSGRVVSTGGLDCAEDEWGDTIEERQVPYAMAMRLRLPSGSGPMVGALARLHHKFDRLAPPVQQLAERVGLGQPDANPFHNNLAQAIELAQCIEICIDALESFSPRNEGLARATRSGSGAALTEAPRGLLSHAYQVDRNGIVQSARIITPTVHNFLCMEEDLRALVSQEYGRDDADLRELCETLVRAYDPCFSCSVH